MAQMIPESLPPRNLDGERITAGERRVFELLSKLPKDYLVYYEPVVRHRHPDFIVILPKTGVLIIEVKGWWHAELQSANPQTIKLNRRGKETYEKHPGIQARDYMRLIMDKCRDHSFAHILQRASGEHQNKFLFPFAYASILSNINRSQLEKGPRELQEIFPEAKTLTRDRLAELETLSGEDLAVALRGYFDPWWPFPKLNHQQIDIIRGIIHPEVVVKQTGHSLAVLDLRQERNARDIGGGHRLIHGVAGSGKTLLLVARAKLLAATSESNKQPNQPPKNILMLCGNKPLAENLLQSVRGYSTISLMHFHKWGGENGIFFRKGEDNDAYGERLLAQFKAGCRDLRRFDAVLIDESQDWPCSWFQCAKLALKEPDTGDLLIVMDTSQALYKRRSFTWAEAGIHAQGRTIHKKFDLDRNYRNTVEILRAAQPFAMQSKQEQKASDVGQFVVPVKPEQALRNGPEPQVIQLKNAEEECHYAAALIETWLLGGIDILGTQEHVAPHQIAVLYPRVRTDVDLAVLAKRLRSFTNVVQLTPPDQASGTLQDNGVRIMTMKSARGLQFRLVVLLWTDLLPYEPTVDQRSELYVAMTRAEDVLVILHSGSSTYVEELRGNKKDIGIASL